MKKKRTILVLISCLEIIIGGILLFNFYQKIVNDRKVLGLKKVAVIDKETVAPVSDSNFKHYWEFTPNSVGEENPEWLSEKAIYYYNADGLNERFDYPVQKEEGVFRIITLGDSFTYGQNVSTEYNWPERLEDLLNAKSNLYGFKKIEVINLGMPGLGIPYINERYKRIGAKYNPDLIIWFESGTGFTRYNELMAPIIKVCLDKVREDFNGKEEDTLFQEQWANCWVNSDKEVLRIYSSEGITQMLKAHLDDFFNQVDPKKVIFFTFEEDLLSQVQKTKINLFGLSSEQKAILNLWRKSYPETIFASIVPNIWKLGGGLEDGHPNKEGHLIIAETIFNYLQDNILKNK